MSRPEEKTALVLAGGGIMGAAYEIGCLTALDHLFSPGFSTRRFDIYVGVSAGAVIATLVANRIAPAGMFRAIAQNQRSSFNFGRSDIYKLDLGEALKNVGKLFPNLVRIIRTYRRNRWKISFPEIAHLLQEQFPAGFFSLGAMQNYLCRSFREEGLKDDFRLLEAQLYIPAIDLDQGARVIFGSDGYRDLHICQAITASCAIPVFFRPYKIGDRYYLDGSIGRLAHIDIAIERGAKLIVVVNPRVPMVNNRDRFCLPSLSFGECSSIAELGTSLVWEQSQRIENREKLGLALEAHRREHPEVDIVLLEPGPEESLLFFQSPMSHEARQHVMNYGYNLTTGYLEAEFDFFQETFGRHGIRTDRSRLSQKPFPAA